MNPPRLKTWVAHSPNTYMQLWNCEKITGLGVMGQHTLETSEPSSTNKVDEAQIEHHHQQDARSENGNVALAEERLLLHP